MDSTYKVTPLAAGLWAIDEGFVRCFLVVGSEQALLIDSCMSVGLELSELVKSLTDKPVDLVFTHTDPDHTGGQEGFGPPMLHPSEYGYYYSKGNEGRPVRPLWEGDVLDLGNRKLEAVLLPGHTPGSIALFDHADRRIYVGDTVSDFWVHLFGGGRNVSAFLDSLRKLERMAKSFDILCPCHGSLELEVEWISKTITAAEKLLAGELEATDPPRPMPCKAYRFEGVTLLY
jgi:glyoxylase-like metal-dependent hydrolase (beta-lactamase superfamily II)